MLPIQFRKKVFHIFLLIPVCVLFANGALAQSTTSEYPTPVTANEVTGKIEPRDVGDPRLTRHFFTFNGTNGDLNITIESENLNGDIDVFTVNGLRPLTKVNIFDTGSKFVTTATVYMRKREALLLRVEARTANDNAGSYRISFSGGFEPVANAGPRPVEPKVTIPKSKEGTIRVNAVGARIEEPKPPVVEKPAPPKTETTVAKTETKTTSAKTTPPKTTAPPRTTPTTKTNTTAKSKKTAGQPTTTTTSNTNADTAKVSSTAKKKEDLAKAAEERRKKAAEARAELERKRKEDAAKAAEERKKRQEAYEERKRETIAKAEANKAKQRNTRPTGNGEDNSSSTSNTPPAPDPMASVRLVVETKDGERIERKMNEVRRVNVEKGVLVVVFVDGKIEKIPMTNVLKMAIEPF